MSGLTNEMILEGFEDDLPPVSGARAVPDERHEQLSFLPPVLHEAWRRWGFGGFGRGLFWLTDPVEWVQAVDAWTAGLDLPGGEDRWWCVGRNAFGDLTLWGERCGPSLTVSPHQGWVVWMDESHQLAKDGGESYAGGLFMRTEDEIDMTGPGGGPGMFDAVEERLGPVGPDEMYSFVPHPRLGGPEKSVATAVIEKAVPQLVLLAGVGKIGILTMGGLR